MSTAYNCFLMSTLLCVVGPSSSCEQHIVCCTTCPSPLTTPSVPSTQTLPGHNPRSTPGPPTVSSTLNPASFQLTAPPTPPDFTIHFQETFQALQLQFDNLRLSELVLNMTHSTVDCLNISAAGTTGTAGGDTVTMTTGSIGPHRVLAASEAGSRLSRTEIIIVSVCVCGGSVLIVVVVAVVVHTCRHNTVMRRHKSSSTTTTTTTVQHQDSISSEITWSTDGGHIGEGRGVARVKRVISETNSHRELLQRSDSDYSTTTTTTTDDYNKQLHLTTASQQVEFCSEQHVC